MLKKFFFLAGIAITAQSIAQDEGTFHGSVQWDAQQYIEDTLINAPYVEEGILSNFRADLLYSKKNFYSGLRFESYQNVMQGFDARFKGNSIMYRYAGFKQDGFDITIGSFYEQFGNGMALRSYYAPTLGYDTFIDGVRVKFTPFEGLQIKSLIGKQRFFMTFSSGIVRGADVDWSLNQTIKKFNDSKHKLILGGSLVSRYQNDDNPNFDLPENVGVYSVRGKYSLKGFSINSEYTVKSQDPHAINQFIYKGGEALVVNMNYYTKGFGAYLGLKRADNMSYRSDRNVTGNAGMINFQPVMTKQHLYSLTNLYPYATNANGEYAINAEVGYKIPKKSKLGGKYGTNLNFNFSYVYALEKTFLEGQNNSFGGKEYTSSWFPPSDSLYFSDINFEIKRKFNKKFKAMALYSKQHYNINVVQGKVGHEMVVSDIFVVEGTYKVTKKNALILQLQNLSSEQEEGSWSFAMLEFTMAPNWFFAVVDQYNYGNKDPLRRVHYYLGSFGYSQNTTRLQISYGKQREGITCVGGVCRFVPASNGLSISLTSSF